MARWTPEQLASHAKLQKEFTKAERQGIKDLAIITRAETANRITSNVIRIINSTPGCVAYRLNNTGIWDESKQIFRRAHTEKGIPDIIACCRGRLFAIEVKAGKDKMSEHQEMRRFEIEKAGGVFLIARSTGLFETDFKASL